MRKLWWSVGGLLIALLTAEIVCRLFVDDPFGEPPRSRESWRVTGLVADPELEFSFQPGYEGRMTLAGEYDVPFRINGQGLRDDHEFAEAHADTRVLLVGDSFVFGVGVELADTLGEQLEAALNDAVAAPDAPAAPARTVEVVAAGVPSYGLDAYAVLVERWMPRLRPDLVVVALHPGNDLLDYELKASDPHTVVDGMLVGRRQAWNWTLSRYSRAAYLLLGDLNPYPRVEQHRPDHPTPEQLAHLVRTIEPWIARLAATQRPGGPPIAVVVCHGRTTVQSWRSGDLAACVPPYREVVAGLQHAGLTVLDPQPAWLAPGIVVEDCFFAHDAHYRPAGNRLVGRWLAQQLRAEWPAIWR